MTLYRRFALPVGAVVFALATAMHLHTVAGTALGLRGDAGLALVSSLGIALPILGVIAAFGVGWHAADAAGDDLEWAATIAIGGLAGWFVGFVGVGYALATLEGSLVPVYGADGLFQSAVVVGASQMTTPILAALAGVAIGSRSHRRSAASVRGSLVRRYRSIALPTAAVTVVVTGLTWVQGELAGAATGQFVPWHVAVASPLAAVLFTLGGLVAAAAVGWLAADRLEGSDYGRFTLAAAVGVLIGWLVGSIVLAIVADVPPHRLIGDVAFSSNVPALIVAVLAGLSMHRFVADSRAVSAE